MTKSSLFSEFTLHYPVAFSSMLPLFDCISHNQRIILHLFYQNFENQNGLVGKHILLFCSNLLIRHPLHMPSNLGKEKQILSVICLHMMVKKVFLCLSYLRYNMREEKRPLLPWLSLL